MNDVIVKDNLKIENMIYEIRGKQVMLDSDLAKLYHVETKQHIGYRKSSINLLRDSKIKNAIIEDVLCLL